MDWSGVGSLDPPNLYVLHSRANANIGTRHEYSSARAFGNPALQLLALWPVGEVEDALPNIFESTCFSAFRQPVPEETLPSAQDNGMNHEPELVERFAGQQRSEEGTAAFDPDVLARLGGQ